DRLRHHVAGDDVDLDQGGVFPGYDAHAAALDGEHDFQLLDQAPDAFVGDVPVCGKFEDLDVSGAAFQGALDVDARGAEGGEHAGPVAARGFLADQAAGVLKCCPTLAAVGRGHGPVHRAE